VKHKAIALFLAIQISEIQFGSNTAVFFLAMPSKLRVFLGVFCTEKSIQAPLEGGNRSFQLGHGHEQKESNGCICF
jgi:hypothetical protein